MTSRNPPTRAVASLHIVALCFGVLSQVAAAQPAAAVSAFNTYAEAVEARLAQQHRSETKFIAPVDPNRADGLRCGEIIVEQLTPAGGFSSSGALLHDWRGTAFVPDATPSDFERLLKNFAAYPQYFAPQVLRAKVLARRGDRVEASMRVSQRHIITVVMDSTYDVTFAQLDAQHQYSSSRSTAISEIESPGTLNEHPLSASQEHGFLWRQNTYWTYEGRDGGLVMQIESISLSRSIPIGLGWVVRPFVESVPRDSLEFTLRSARNALRK
jgi:hypothetical protein